jgi:hypothetical protein
MLRSSLAVVGALASMAVACASSNTFEPDDGGSDGGGGDVPDAASDSRVADAALDSRERADGDGIADAAPDVHAPAAPSCPAGDRKEWAGAIPKTVIAVAVCSTCGESYVVAANGDTSSGEVTVDNGMKTIKTTVAAGGTATSAKLADNPNDGTVSVCGTSGASHGCLPVAPQNQQYCNPYRAVGSLVPERIDQGVDYAGAGSIYALGPGHIDQYRNRDDNGWPGGTFVSYKLSAGPAMGKVVYLAENIDLNPLLHAGSFVYGGTVLGTLVNAFPNSESGWGVAGQGYTAEFSCYTEGCTTALGLNFNDLLVCLKAPSGIKEQTGCCTSTAGYPGNWCTLLAGWQ